MPWGRDRVLFQFHFGQTCVYMGYSAQEHTRLCRLLADNGVWYDVADADRRADDLRLRGGLGERADRAKLYRIYVRDRDAELARYLLRRPVKGE